MPRTRAHAIRSLYALMFVIAVSAAILAGAAPRSTGLQPTIVFSSGGTKGVYHAYSRALQGLAENDQRLRIEVHSSNGSIENLDCVIAGSCDIAFSAADAAAERFRSTDRSPLRALARLYDDYIHLLVPARSAIRSLGDLRGKRVSIGPPGSGTALIARRVLDLGDVQLDHLKPLRLGIDESLEQLRTGNTDAVFWSGGLPTSGVAELAATMPLRLVPLSEYADDMSKLYGPAYRKATLLDGIYSGIPQTATIAVPNYLVTRATMDNATVFHLLDLLYGNPQTLVSEVAVASWLHTRTAIFTDPLALHPGALEFYRDRKP